MGNESTSLSKASLKPGYFVAYSFSPVISPPIQSNPPPTETQKPHSPMQYRQEQAWNPRESAATEEYKEATKSQAVEELLHRETTEEEQETAQSPNPLQVSETLPPAQPSTVDYSDDSAARAALLTRLKAAGKAQPLSNGELLEAMYRNKRKKTEVKGGTGEVECRPQQSVAALKKQFSHS